MRGLLTLTTPAMMSNGLVYPYVWSGYLHRESESVMAVLDPSDRTRVVAVFSFESFVECDDVPSDIEGSVWDADLDEPLDSVHLTVLREELPLLDGIREQVQGLGGAADAAADAYAQIGRTAKAILLTTISLDDDAEGAPAADPARCPIPQSEWAEVADLAAWVRTAYASIAIPSEPWPVLVKRLLQQAAERSGRNAVSAPQKAAEIRDDVGHLSAEDVQQASHDVAGDAEIDEAQDMEPDLFALRLAIQPICMLCRVPMEVMLDAVSQARVAGWEPADDAAARAIKQVLDVLSSVDRKRRKEWVRILRFEPLIREVGPTGKPDGYRLEPLPRIVMTMRAAGLDAVYLHNAFGDYGGPFMDAVLRSDFPTAV